MNASEYNERLKNFGRNDPCPCGSGKKYKHCHRSEDEAAKHSELAEAAEKREAALAAEESDEDDKAPEKSKVHRDEHQRRGKKHQSESRSTSIPRRGAI